MDLEIIVKTCDSNDLSLAPRICKYSKLEIIKKCISSIALSASQTDKSTKINIVDDASSTECITEIKKILDHSLIKYEILTNKKNNFFENTYKAFQIAKNSDATLVYCVDDDYLHEPQSISELVKFYDFAFNQLGKLKDVVLCPNDEVDNYEVRYISPAHIVLGHNRHWRTNVYANCTFMTTPGLIRRNWSDFENYCKNSKSPKDGEIYLNNVWNLNTTQLFSPLPSLAFHLTEESKTDRYVNWEHLWDSIPNLTK